MGGMIPEELGLRIALEIVSGSKFNTGDAEADSRTIEIEAAILRRMRELHIDVQIPNYCEGMV